ncbi:MAG: DUF1343 domain-containing protein, partial [Leptospira sp.]|nr:DUF1343 domain-containing protein [Leptospira sp.]
MKIRKYIKKIQGRRAGILTNQSAFGWNKTYHFENYAKFFDLKYIFLPEHGLFAELQDQVSGKELRYNYTGIKTENLYGDEEISLFIREQVLDEIDLIIFDIRDVGARYYTFLTTCFYIMQGVKKHNSQKGNKIEILVVDSPNPIGRKVEGSPLQKEFSSFVGVESVLHRHGLTPAELMNFYNGEFDLGIKLYTIPIGIVYPKKDRHKTWVPPSPNIPTLSTCAVYPGQCLLEGTNLSEGRGTTRPFEIFGAPFIDIQDKSLLSELLKYESNSLTLRPLFFQPAFHKHQGKICGGFQILGVNPKKFHSLLFSLHALRTISEFYPNKFEYLKGVYEFRSDRPA